MLCALARCLFLSACLSFGVETDLAQKKCSNSCPVFLLCMDDDLTKGVSVARRRGGAVRFRGEGERPMPYAHSRSLYHPLLPNRGALFRK